jgi:hypothetical protein
LVYFLEIIGLRSKGGCLCALRKIKEETDLMSKANQPFHCLRILHALYTGILAFGQSNQKLGLLG